MFSQFDKIFSTCDAKAAQLAGELIFHSCSQLFKQPFIKTHEKTPQSALIWSAANRISGPHLGFRPTPKETLEIWREKRRTLAQCLQTLAHFLSFLPSGFSQNFSLQNLNVTHFK